MITLPSDIKQDGNWSGVSTNYHSGMSHKNLDSKIDFAEHQAIVLKAGALLANLNYTAEELANNRAKKMLIELKALYHGANNTPIYISKGIHQRESDPHIQLTATIDNYEHVWHLNVAENTIVLDDKGDDHFFWEGTCFSAQRRNGNQQYGPDPLYDKASWPEGVAISPAQNRARRNSITPVGLLTLNQQIKEEAERAAKAEAAENARKAKEAADVEANKKKQQLQAKVAPRLKSEKLTPNGHLEMKKLMNNESAKFLDGKKAPVTCTLDGDFLVIAGRRVRI